MALGRGDKCYFIEEGKVTLGRISGKRDNNYFIQVVGKCGTVQLEEEDLYKTETEAEKAMEKSKPIINSFF